MLIHIILSHTCHRQLAPCVAESAQKGLNEMAGRRKGDDVNYVQINLGDYT